MTLEQFVFGIIFAAVALFFFNLAAKVYFKHFHTMQVMRSHRDKKSIAYDKKKNKFIVFDRRNKRNIDDE